MIDLTENQKKIIGDILQNDASGYEVRAYGSRVDGTSHAGSDLDLVVVDSDSNAKIDWLCLARLREAFADSDLPFRVDVFDWHQMPRVFQENIAKKYVVLQKSDSKAPAENL